MLICHSTCPDLANARTLARTLVDECLAACVQIVPGVESIYRWQGQVEQACEHLLLIKTSKARWPLLRARVLELHPYEVPELIALDVHEGAPAYLAWLAAQTAGEAA